VHFADFVVESLSAHSLLEALTAKDTEAKL